MRTVVTITDGNVGLVSRHGQFQHQVDPGRHVFWGRGISVEPVDVRDQEIVVEGQGLLTVDGLAVKASAIAGLRIADARRVTFDVQYWRGAMYSALQLALREVIGSKPVEELLEERSNLGDALLGAARPAAEDLGIAMIRMDLRDLMLSADLKNAVADVFLARKEAEAHLERTRGESAALRNLANAGRLVDEIPGLFGLRLLQTLQDADGPTPTVVLDANGGRISGISGPGAPERAAE